MHLVHGIVSLHIHRCNQGRRLYAEKDFTSMSVLPESANNAIRNVLMDLLLSILLSVPTSSLQRYSLETDPPWNKLTEHKADAWTLAVSGGLATACCYCTDAVAAE